MAKKRPRKPSRTPNEPGQSAGGGNNSTDDLTLPKTIEPSEELLHALRPLISSPAKETSHEPKTYTIAEHVQKHIRNLTLIRKLTDQESKSHVAFLGRAQNTPWVTRDTVITDIEEWIAISGLDADSEERARLQYVHTSIAVSCRTADPDRVRELELFVEWIAYSISRFSGDLSVSGAMKSTDFSNVESIALKGMSKDSAETDNHRTHLARRWWRLQLLALWLEITSIPDATHLGWPEALVGESDLQKKLLAHFASFRHTLEDPAACAALNMGGRTRAAFLMSDNTLREAYVAATLEYRTKLNPRSDKEPRLRSHRDTAKWMAVRTFLAAFWASLSLKQKAAAILALGSIVFGFSAEAYQYWRRSTAIVLHPDHDGPAELSMPELHLTWGDLSGVQLLDRFGNVRELRAQGKTVELTNIHTAPSASLQQPTPDSVAGTFQIVNDVFAIRATESSSTTFDHYLLIRIGPRAVIERTIAFVPIGTETVPPAERIGDLILVGRRSPNAQRCASNEVVVPDIDSFAVVREACADPGRASLLPICSRDLIPLDPEIRGTAVNLHVRYDEVQASPLTVGVDAGTGPRIHDGSDAFVLSFAGGLRPNERPSTQCTDFVCTTTGPSSFSFVVVSGTVEPSRIHVPRVPVVVGPGRSQLESIGSADLAARCVAP